MPDSPEETSTPAIDAKWMTDRREPGPAIVRPDLTGRPGTPVSKDAAVAAVGDENASVIEKAAADRNLQQIDSQVVDRGGVPLTNAKPWGGGAVGTRETTGDR